MPQLILHICFGAYCRHKNAVHKKAKKAEADGEGNDLKTAAGTQRAC